jgi:hypothetical protein
MGEAGSDRASERRWVVRDIPGGWGVAVERMGWKGCNRTFPASSTSTTAAGGVTTERVLGPSEEKAMERMIASLERIKVQYPLVVQRVVRRPDRQVAQGVL